MKLILFNWIKWGFKGSIEWSMIVEVVNEEVYTGIGDRRNEIDEGVRINKRAAEWTVPKIGSGLSGGTHRSGWCRRGIRKVAAVAGHCWDRQASSHPDMSAHTDQH